MTQLDLILTWIAQHGYWFVLGGLALMLCVRDRQKRVAVLRPLLIMAGIVVGSIFLAAAYGKLKPIIPGFPWSVASVRVSITWFATQVESYKLLSSEASNFVAHVLPFFELFLGLWLVSGIARRYSGLTASIILFGFMSAITYAYVRGLKIKCGCGVGDDEDVGPAALLRDGLQFLLPALLLTIGAFLIQRKRGDAPLPESAPSVTHAD
jgi:methylamine utilization protein MauE